MLTIPLLLVGSGFDGPIQEPILCNNSEDALNIFGGYKYESHTIATSSTSITLQETPLDGNIFVYRKTTSGYYPYYLYSLSVSGSQVSFAKTGEEVSLVIKYIRDLEETNVSRGYLQALAGNPSDVYLMRIGGTKLVTTVGSGSSYVTLESIYPGDLYNNVSISTSGSSLVISGLDYRYSPQVYEITTAEKLYNAVNYNKAKGKSPVEATFYTGGTLPLSTNIDSAGSDGTMSAAEVSGIIDYYDFNGVDVLCFLGLPIEDIYQDVLSIVEYIPYPTAIIQNTTPITSSVTTTEYVTALNTSSYNNKFLSLTTQTLQYNPIPGVMFWGYAAPAYAGLLSNELYTTTNKSIKVSDISPRYSYNNLSSLVSGGYIALTWNKGIIVYNGNTTDPDVNVIAIKILQEVASQVYDYFDSLIGNNFYSKSTMESQVEEILNGISYIRDYSVGIRASFDLIEIEIDLLITGEVRSIHLNIGVAPRGTINI